MEAYKTIIKPSTSLFDLKIKEIWNYRDLLWLLVKRDVVTVYKQTILGPLWYVIQPILTTGMFTFVFGKLAGISTNGLPHVAFYLLGVTVWNYFSECLTKTSNTFVVNQGVFGKVYFPRIIVPASIVISSLGKFFIQLFMFLLVFLFFWDRGEIEPNLAVILLPVVIVIMAVTSLGFGMLFSSLTTKYRDLSFLLSFGVQLWMYATPVIYPISSIPERYASIIKFNPISPLIESMRYGFLGKGSFEAYDIVYSLLFAICIFAIGFLTFSNVEKKFMDTV